MTTIVTRAGKGSPLTHTEVDTNFTNLNTNKLETAAIPLGTAAAPSISFLSDANTGIYSPGADQVAVATNGVQRLIVDANGNIGVGTSNPANSPGFVTLALADSSGSEIDFIKGSTVQSALYNTSDIFYVEGKSTVPIAFVTNGSERARIDSSGGLLVGTSTNTLNINNTDKQAIVLIGDDTYGGLAITGYNGTSNTTLRGPRLTLQRSRGTTDGSMTKVALDDLIGQISFRGADGTDFEVAATIEACVDGEFASADATDSPGRLVFSTTANGSSSATERMRINSAGNVLIGDTSVYAACDGLLSVVKSSSSTASPTLGVINPSATAAYVSFSDSAVVYGSITRVSSATVYNTTSDYRLKTVIGIVSDAGQRIDSLRPVEYTWNADSSRSRGFLAHEFQEVYAGSVSGTKDAVDAVGNPIYQAMQASTSEVIADLVAEIQSLRARLAALEAN